MGPSSDIDYKNKMDKNPQKSYRELWRFKRVRKSVLKGRDYFKGVEEANTVLKKITDAWDNKIMPKYGAKLKKMKTEDKVNLFNDTKILFWFLKTSTG